MNSTHTQLPRWTCSHGDNEDPLASNVDWYFTEGDRETCPRKEPWISESTHCGPMCSRLHCPDAVVQRWDSGAAVGGWIAAPGARGQQWLRVEVAREFGDAGEEQAGCAELGLLQPGVADSSDAERLKARLGEDITHLPYKGSGPLLTDIIGGSVAGAIDTLPAMLPMIKTNKVRAQVVVGTQRHPLLPDVSTVVEARYPDLLASSWFDIAVPTGTPKEIVERMNREINQALRIPAVQACFAEFASPRRPAHPTRCRSSCPARSSAGERSWWRRRCPSRARVGAS